jgi:hypothetical protein
MPSLVLTTANKNGRAAIFVFFQSLTNQFVNSPIGMSMVLLSIVVLDIMNTKNNPATFPRQEKLHKRSNCSRNL